MDVLAQQELAGDHEWSWRLRCQCVERIDDIEQAVREAHQVLTVLLVDTLRFPDLGVEPGRRIPPHGQNETQADREHAGDDQLHALKLWRHDLDRLEQEQGRDEQCAENDDQREQWAAESF